MKKIKVIFICLVILLSLAACQKTPNEVISKNNFSMGHNELPNDFLEWWFDQVPKIEDFESQLVMKREDIVNSQYKVNTPIIDEYLIPEDFLSLHTQVKSQGQNGTCWAFATVGSLESALRTQLGETEISNKYPFVDTADPYNSIDLSEQYGSYYNIDWDLKKEADYWHMEYQETNEDRGGNAFYSTYNIYRRGVPLESDVPYLTEDYDWIRFNTTDVNWKSHLIKCEGTVVINSGYSFSDYSNYVNTIKSVLMEYGALAVSIKVYEGFYSYEKGVYFPSGERKGGHAILLVGWWDKYYDENTDYYGPVWILKNSWGTDWGLDGYWLQPFSSEYEFNNNIPDWKIENKPMYVPLLY